MLTSRKPPSFHSLEQRGLFSLPGRLPLLVTQFHEVAPQVAFAVDVRCSEERARLWLFAWRL